MTWRDVLLTLLVTAFWAVIVCGIVAGTYWAYLGLAEPDRQHELPPWGDVP
jgi:hypothetical protein